MQIGQIAAQGDIIIQKINDKIPEIKTEINRDPDNAVVLARGEVTGHRHAFYNNAVMFRDDAYFSSLSAELKPLYVGHVVLKENVPLKHEEHDAIELDRGTYIVSRQR